MKRIFAILVVIMLTTSVQAEEVCLKSLSEMQVVALTLLMEARCQGKEGMIAVLNVVTNRANKSNKGLKYECLKYKQFSCWNQPIKVNFANKLLFSPEGLVAWELSQKAGNKGNISDITGRATHYHNDKIHKPYWAKYMTKTVKIGNHIFYRES